MMKSSGTARATASLLVALSVLGVPSVSLAYTVRWCTYEWVQYSDSGFDEDYWSETSYDTFKQMYGASYVLRTHTTNQLVSSGYLGDGLNAAAGCTALLNMAAGSYDLYVYSAASVQSNTITVGDTNGQTQVMARYAESVTKDDTKLIYFAPTPDSVVWRVFNVQQAAAWALYRHAAGLSGKTFDVQVGDPTGCNAGPDNSCNQGGIIYIDNSRIIRKFRIVHEVGHRLASNRGIAAAASYSYDGQGQAINPACGTGGAQWQPESLEWVGAAVHEGFADFYTADVWNDHDQTDCWTVYPDNQAVDCAGDLTFENAWVDGNTCRTPDDPESGADVDWVRIFWDVHTNGPAPDPTFTYIARDWMEQAGPWTKNTAFTVLYLRAAVLGGDLNSNWLGGLSTHAPYY